ncbi:MAG: hypothetical protein ACNS61_13195, partial [Candidatus Wenzhouxiangella sp. M2_3B_020]
HAVDEGGAVIDQSRQEALHEGHEEGTKDTKKVIPSMSFAVAPVSVPVFTVLLRGLRALFVFFVKRFSGSGKVAPSDLRSSAFICGSETGSLA